MQPPEALWQSLKTVLAPQQIITNPLELLTYEVDAALDRGTPDGAVFPRTAEEVVRLVKWAQTHHVPLVARGAGTGLSGGAVAEHGGLIVEFSRMNRIVNFWEAGRAIAFEPGVINQTLDELVRTKGLYYPPDPSSGRSATMGGNLAENAGGPHCFKYGVTTNYITGLDLVTAAGERVRLGGLVLDYPEYDLVGLLNGSEGTLGLITQASARLLRNAPAIKTMMAAFDTVEAAGVAVSAVIARGLVPATLEMMDQKMMRIIEAFVHAGLPVEAGAGLIVEADGYAESVAAQIEEIAAVLRDHGAHDLRIAQTAEERNKIWYGRKSAVGAMSRLAPQFLLLDGSVPRSRLAATLSGINTLCDAAGLRVGYVFHAGDGNLHPLILIENPDDRAGVERVLATGQQVMELCVNMGGSITGEHGVGIEKRAFMPLMYTADELQTMREVKEVFDPQNLLNPGKMLPPPTGPRLLPTPAPGPAPAGQLWAPGSTPEAAQMVLAGAQRSLRLRGGGTKSGLLPPADVTLSTHALRGLADYSLDDLWVTVRAGTPVAQMQSELEQHKMWVPLAAPWAASTVGGLVAANYNAPLRMRYGAVRDLVLALTVVLPDGRVIRAGRSVVKNVAGYDMPKLFVGSYGTLGLITDVTLKLMPLPRARQSLIVPVDDLGCGLTWGARLLPICLTASALLLCSGGAVPGVSAPYAMIYTAEGMPEDVTAELTQVQAALRAEGLAAPSPMETPSGTDVWSGLLSGTAEAEVLLRAGVAPHQMAGWLECLQPALSEALFLADVASGLLYVRSAQAAVVEAVRQAAQTIDGYGVVLHAPQPPSVVWGHLPEARGLMQALKARWNPRGLFNPGAFIV
jgi:D-lactate dehydrogenase (cytochrome)